MTDSTATTPNDPAGPWAIPVRRPLPGEDKPRSTTSFPRKVWKLLVAIKDALALIFLLLFFVALFGLLAGRPNAGLPVSEGALLIELDGIVTEQPTETDPFAALSGGPQLKEIRTRDVVHALETAASDKRITSVVLDLDRFLGGGQVSLAEIGGAIDKVRAKKKPVLAFATAYTTDSYQIAAHASEIWADSIGGVAIAGPGGSRLYYKGLMDRLGITANIYRVGTFKSAVEPYLRSDQSPEAKEANLAYASVLWDNWLADVKKARPAAKLDAYIADTVGAVRAAGNDLSKASLDAGLVDRLGSRMAFSRRVAEISGATDEGKPWEFNAIPLENWVAANPPAEKGSAIAVVPVVGDIVDGEAPTGLAGGTTIAEHILDAATDSSVKAIVLRVDSPGGSVLASEEIRQALLAAKARKLPVVVSMANVAASGGYWISTPADRIFAEPETITGSIGVFGILPSFDRALAKIGVNADGIATTPLSGQPDIFGGVNEEFNALAQASVEDVYTRFTGLVAKSRKQPLDKILPIAEGRVWAGGTARQLGLVDQFGGLPEALAAAAKLAKVEGDFHARYFEEEPSELSRLLANWSGAGEEETAALPRGWFGIAAMNRQLTERRLVQDLALLTRVGSVQAACLDCRAYLPAIPRPGKREAQGFLATLAMLLK
ncbi:signal peptide peptidase SppA [Sphingopyxis alaskensis]|jgi:protease-4|uniref:Signal peptide peptidase SppA, 67K type n=1 Tax=Sphingopyxis alaskensis (strain DSM 13593 / LMG 18877 / RB2256) TaxID=317655 RepID=Q1GQZ2_SPHAL|nr:signal peptide peptidase SppA [Sphingopyxis alaskensis]ABF53930.1 signal peptide peptidase SppA, 67K type [Sphingopyxis alaskensis RB2256]MCM3420737.1 signal peptide peptidase SppA [Sphingopyxis alaskensis]